MITIPEQEKYETTFTLSTAQSRTIVNVCNGTKAVYEKLTAKVTLNGE